MVQLRFCSAGDRLEEDTGRAWAKYDYSVSGINDPYVEKKIKAAMYGDDARIALWKRTNGLVKQSAKLSYWDVQWGFVKYSQNQLVIVPKYNLISNIGIGADSTHASGVGAVHRKYHDYNNMPVRSLEFPLAHPEHMICDTDYDRLLLKCNEKAKHRLWITAARNKVKKSLWR